MTQKLAVLFVLVLAVLSTGCATNSTGAVPRDAEIILAHGPTATRERSEVGTYVSSWDGFRTSSYWIEGPSGLILIDTQFLLSAAGEMVDWAEMVTGKKAVLAIVLHPNPDKFNGTSVFQKRGIRVITSEQVAKRIPSVHKLRTTWFYDRFKPDYPAEEPKPETFGSASLEIEAAGLKLKLYVLGPGCSEEHVIVQFKDHVFVGDLVTQGFHSWLELGLLNEWLKRLEEIKAMNPEFVHPGRGGSGDSELVDKEQQYLESVIRIVKSKQRKFRSTGYDDRVGAEILDEIVAAFPAYEYPKFVENSLPMVWEKLKQAK